MEKIALLTAARAVAKNPQLKKAIIGKLKQGANRSFMKANKNKDILQGIAKHHKAYPQKYIDNMRNAYDRAYQRKTLARVYAN